MKKCLIGGVLVVASSFLFGDDPWKGEEYAKHSESQQSSAETLLKNLNLQQDHFILDVGCGDGKITASMAGAVPDGQVIGIDISPSMIDFANLAFSHIPNLKFFVEDAARIEYSEEFDLITSFTVMQWVVQQKLALQGFKRALKPGGKLCILMPTGLPLEMRSILNQMLVSEEWSSYFTDFTPPWIFFQADAYRELVLKVGLAIERLDTTPKYDRFPSRAAFQGFVRQWFPYLRALPDPFKDLFLTQLIDGYLELVPVDEAGQVSFNITQLELEAMKL